MGSTNHADVDSDDELPTYPTDRDVEYQLTAYGAVGCQTVANVFNFHPPVTWGDDEFDPLDAILVVQNDPPEAEEPLLNDEILRE